MFVDDFMITTKNKTIVAYHRVPRLGSLRPWRHTRPPGRRPSPVWVRSGPSTPPHSRVGIVIWLRGRRRSFLRVLRVTHSLPAQFLTRSKITHHDRDADVQNLLAIRPWHPWRPRGGPRYPTDRGVCYYSCWAAGMTGPSPRSSRRPRRGILTTTTTMTMTTIPLYPESQQPTQHSNNRIQLLSLSLSSPFATVQYSFMCVFLIVEIIF